MNRKKYYLLQFGLCLLIALTLFVPAKLSAQNSGGVSGVITDETTAETLVGVSVKVKGSDITTSTNIKGEYAVNAGINDTLLLSYVGYIDKEIKIESQTLNITMTADNNVLDQVVVVGYGTQRKRDLTGAIAQVSAEKLENENPNTVQDILRGNAAGLNVGYAADAKGGGDLQVRGRKSLNAGGTPLIVVDGVIYYGELTDINPNDIQSLDVLKDASSTAVFGAKAANGVIMIVTKKGKDGKPVINLNSSIALATMSVNQPVNSPEEYLAWRTDAFENRISNFKPYQFDDPRTLPPAITVEEWLAYDRSSGDPVNVWLQRINLRQVEIDNYKAGKTIDWYDRMFHNGIQQDHNASISGSKSDMSYYWSLGKQDNQGIVVGDRFSTIRSRLNLEGTITKFLKVGLNTQFSDRDESAVPVEVAQLTYVSPYGSEFNDDGSLRFSPQDDPISYPIVSRNPLLERAYTDRLKKYTSLTASLYANVTLPFGFSYQLNFSPRFEWNKYLNHQSKEHPEWALQGGIATRMHSEVYNWQIDNLLKWNRTFNDIHKFDVTLLANAEKYQLWTDSMSNNRFDPSDILGYGNMGTGINPIIKSNDESSTGDALMARLSYSLKDRYLLTLSVRRDGYSAFGQKNPRATFPAAALGWIFTDENFFQSKWLTYGKLRVSYGINGNRDIGRYVALSQLASGNYLHVTPGGTVNSVTMLQVSTMSNPDLKWERTTSYNIGMDFTIFDNIINGSIDAYNMSTSDLLVQRSLPSVMGYQFVMANLGEVKNKGFEINLNSKNIQKENFSWNTSFNFSLNRNKIGSLYGDKQDVLDNNGNVTGQKELDDVTNKWFIGHAIDEIWDFKTLGIWQLDEAAEAAKYGVKPGDFKLEDVNNDGIYTNADRQFLGFREPRARWTLRNDFSLYRNFTFSFMLYSYWGQQGTYNTAKNDDGYEDRNNSYHLPYWTPENPINDYARIASSSGGAVYDVYRAKSFIRLDNITMAYNLPKTILDKVNIQNAKVLFSTRNVGFYAPDTFLWDPENEGPTPRTYTLGLNITL